MKLTIFRGAVVEIDEVDFDRFKKLHWTLDKKGAVRRTTIDGRGDIYMHHEVLGPIPHGLVCDHKNGNKQDNRRENLRYVTQAQNNQNRHKGKLLGVFKSVRGKPFFARIVKDKQHHHLGCFRNEIEAAKAYDKKAIELYGNEATLNFPEEVLA